MASNATSRNSEMEIKTPAQASCLTEPTSLLVLNEHCLEHIIGHLTILEQYQMMRMHSRLKRCVKSIWKLHLKVAQFEQTDFDRFDFEDSDFLDLMLSISPYVECLTLNYLERERLYLLRHCYFVRVHSLDCVDPYVLSRCMEERYGHEVITIIENSFPNLVKLMVKGFRITMGKRLFGMTNLKHLQLNFL